MTDLERAMLLLEHYENRAKALLGHDSENALDEILTTLETLFSK